MPVRPPSPSDDHELAELPPLDDDGEEDNAVSETPDDALGQGDAEGDLDDRTGEDDAPHPADVEVDTADEQWLEEPADAKDLDIGEVDLDPLDAPGDSMAGGEDADTPDEDPSIGEAFGSSGLDGGEEGPEGPDEELRDQDLPELGDAEGDEGHDDLTAGDFPAADEPLGLGWALHPWTRVGAPIPVASGVAITCTPRGAFVAGFLDSHSTRQPSELLRVDLEGGCQAVRANGLAGSIHELSADGELLAVRCDGGRVFLSYTGQTFVAVDGIDQVADALVVAGRLWMRAESGELLSTVPGSGGGVHVHAVGGKVAALTVAGPGEVVALLADDANRAVGLVTGMRDGTLREVPTAFLGPASTHWRVGDQGIMAARGTRVAFATREGVVWGAIETGWESRSLGGSILALAFVDGGETLLAAVYSEADDTTGLVCVGKQGPPKVVAVLGATQADMESDGKVRDLASDDPLGVVWVVGGFGVAAFSTR